ncbi:vacuolar protein sorting-associated protein 16-like protein [Elysia marginata]|uniref:Vacuolar protein sorting-associated protein 16-like protein n=1 Tax=Elysia marginata TaxID=1093978 RepID=A0AAV4IU60_9GAST|nr:vacuolar protein sorting-associated protein 16-like protein [Elysia marginata]
MATADWNPLGDVYYRKCELYAMEWSGLVDLAKHSAAVSTYGGPIALMKDESKLSRVVTNVKPVVSVYNAAGRLQSQMRWNSGNVITMGWSSTEELLCIQEDGVVLVYDMFLSFKRTFSMGQEAKDVKIIDAKVFSSFQGTGIAVITTSLRIFVVSNVDSPRIVRLAEVPGLNEPPSCWSIVVTDRQARALVALGSDLFLWNSGNVITMGWSSTEELLCIQEDGVVLVYDMFLSFKRTFSMGQEAKDVKIIDAKVFSSFQGTGIAVITTSLRIFVVSNVDSPRIVRLAEVPGLNEPPSCWSIVVTDRQARALVALGSDLFLVDQGGQYQQMQADLSEDAGSITGMAVSFNSKFLALCTQQGALWIGSSDLQKKYCEFNTKSTVCPQQLVWCGNGAVVALWDRLILVVGPDKDWIRLV